MPRPGVEVTTQVLAGPSTTGDTSGRFFVAGLTERGPIDAPLLVSSLAQYTDTFGGRQSYTPIYDALSTFFAEGGGQAVVCRVTGPAGTVGTLDLQDRGAAPAATLTINAANPGAWSTDVTVEVADGSVADTFTLTVALAGTVVETYRNLASPAAAVAALASSAYVRAADKGSVNPAPTNNPAVIAATPLSAGTDDRASVTAANIAAGLDLAGEDYGPGAVACPGQTVDQIADAVLAHCQRLNRVALFALDAAADVAAATAAADAITVNGEYGTILYPWVQIPDAGGNTLTVPPEGFAAACRARAFAAVGAWQVPAAPTYSGARYVTAPSIVLSSTDGEQLNDAGVSVIRLIAGTTRLYGWRSLTDEPTYWAMLSYRDLFNVLAYQLQAVGQDFLFATVDAAGITLGNFASQLSAVLGPVADAGGLYPNGDVDPGYTVDTGPGVNTPSVLASNTIAAVIRARLSPVAELIQITTVRAALNAAI